MNEYTMKPVEYALQVIEYCGVSPDNGQVLAKVKTCTRWNCRRRGEYFGPFQYPVLVPLKGQNGHTYLMCPVCRCSFGEVNE